MNEFTRYIVNNRSWLYTSAALIIIITYSTKMVSANNYQSTTFHRQSISFSKNNVNFSVLGNLEWQDTGVTVQAGEMLTIQYVSGLWSPWPGGFYDGRGVYNGEPCQQGQECILFSVAHASLIGRIGNGDPFYIGNGTTISAGASDHVYFRMNDSRLSDNSGSLLTTIQVTSPSPQQTNLMLPMIMNPLLPIIPETTRLLSSATTENLTSVSADGAVFTFKQMTPELANLSTGDVMVGDRSTAAPLGFLRKVTSVTTKNKQVIVQTELATLEDAIEQGEIDFNKTFAPQNVQSSILARGVTLQKDSSFRFEIKDVVLYDDDGNQNTTNDQVRANGSITLDPFLDFSAKIQHRQLEKLIFIENVKETAELSVESGVEIPVVKGEVEIARQYLSPFVVQVGFVPVVFTPVLSIHVGIDGKIHAGVTAGVTQEFTLKAGARYEDNSWNPEQELTYKFEPKLPTLSAGLELKGYTGGRLALMVYGVAGPQVDVNPFVKLEADIFAVPWWKLAAGLEVPLGVKIEIFSRRLAGYEVSLIAFEDVLAQAELSKEGTCGKFFYINQGVDNWPVFLPNGSIEPWFIDPFIASIFQDGRSATIHGAEFMNNDWGAIGTYENARWLMEYSSIDYQTECPTLDTNDTIAFTSGSSTIGGIYLMNSAGGDIRKIAALMRQDDIQIQCPNWSPNGNEVAFYKKIIPDVGDIYIVSSNGITIRNSTNSTSWYAKPTWSPDGKLFAYSVSTFPFRLIAVDSSESWQIRKLTDDDNPDWSPSGDRLIFNAYRWDKDPSVPPSDIFTIKRDGTDLRSLTDDPWRNENPAWSPDGSTIVFASNRDGDYEIFTMTINGTNPQQLTNNTSVDSEPIWSPNGSQIAFVSNRDGNNEIHIMNSDGSGQHNITNTPFNEYCPDWFGVR